MDWVLRRRQLSQTNAVVAVEARTGSTAAAGGSRQDEAEPGDS